MFYAILGIVVAVALFLIFRDDHDSSYNRNEKKSQRPESAEKKYPAWEEYRSTLLKSFLNGFSLCRESSVVWQEMEFQRRRRDYGQIATRHTICASVWFSGAGNPGL